MFTAEQAVSTIHVQLARRRLHLRHVIQRQHLQFMVPTMKKTVSTKIRSCTNWVWINENERKIGRRKSFCKELLCHFEASLSLCFLLTKKIVMSGLIFPTSRTLQLECFKLLSFPFKIYFFVSHKIIVFMLYLPKKMNEILKESNGK